MWPWSTIRNFRRELEQADKANATLSQKIHDTNTEWRKAYGEKEHALLVVKGELLAKKNEVRNFNGAQLADQHAQMTLRTQLAAERDEAVLRARNVEKTNRALIVEYEAWLRRYREVLGKLQGALVRDPKTGRLIKWVEQIHSLPEPQVSPVFAELTEVQKQVHEALK